MIRVEKYDFGHYGYSNGQNVWQSHKADSAGGVSVKYTVKNYGRKPVKKYAIYFKAYNGADEIVNCTVRRESIVGVSDADRVEPYAFRDGLLKNAWYNNSIRHISIDHIDVVYTDDTTESCVGNHILTAEEKADLEAQHQKDLQDGKSCCLVGVVIMIILFIFGPSFF